MTKFMSDEDFLKQYFPEVDHGVDPFGDRVLVQYKLVRTVSHGGIVLVEDTKDVQKENTVLARVVKLGPIAYCNRETGKPWIEGAWAKVGDVVLVPRWGGFRFPRTLPNSEDKVIFAMFKDYEIFASPRRGYDELDQVL